jgi:hypothetical protein
VSAIAFEWESLVRTLGKPAPWTTWSDLFRAFEAGASAFRGQKDHPGWSAAIFEPPYRAEANVQRVTALVLDYDDTATIDAAAETWSCAHGLIHTSKRHSPDAHRFRVVMPFMRHVSSFEYAAIWRRADAHAGGKIDAAAKDASRFWYLPCTVDGGPYETRRLDGKRLDPDEWLRKPEPTSPAIQSYDTNDIHGDIKKRASAYLAKMPEAIAHQGGHKAAFKAALAMLGFGLSEDAIFRILWNEYNQRCSPPWSEKELRHKARQAVTRARDMAPGALLADDEDRHQRWIEETGRRTNWGGDAQDPDPDYTPEPVGEAVATDAAVTESSERQPGEDDEDASAMARHGVVTIKEAFNNALTRAQCRERAMGFTTGHFKLDDALGGIRVERIVTVGAMTNWGKSTFATMIVDENDRAGVRCLIVSGEDATSLYENRLVCRRTRVNALRLRDGECDDDDVRKIALAEVRTSAAPFVLSGVGKPVEVLAKAIRELVREEGIQLVVVDYLQCFRFARRSQDRRNEVTDVARAFGDAIKSSKAAGVFLSQLRRMENPNSRPSMFDLKESGDIENESDHILLGYWQGRGSNDERRMIVVEKNKDGPVDGEEILMPFSEDLAAFTTQVGVVMSHHEVSDDDIDDIIEDRRYV